MSPEAVRLVAVVVCDVDRSTELRLRLGDHDADQLMGQLQLALRAAVASHGALSSASTGDGLWAVLPAASAGLNAAVASSHAAKRLARRVGIDFTIRVGVAAGDVRFDEHDVRGLAMVQATRLAQTAEPGAILATETVAALAAQRTAAGHHYSLDETTSLPLKGIEGLTRVCRVRFGPPSADSELTAPTWGRESAEWPLVGREIELERLDESVKQSLAGSNDVVVVKGPPGMGKTRLVTEVARRMSERGIAVLGGRCQEGGSDPYQPFAEAFERALISSPGWIAQVPSDALASELAALTPAFEDGPLPSGQLRPLDSHTGQARIHHAVIRLLDALAQIEPLVLIIDDAQWATPTTCQLLGALVEALRLRNEKVDRTSGRNWGNGITVIVTCRSGPRDAGAAPDLPDGLRPHLESAPALELAGLDEARVGELVEVLDDVGEDHRASSWSPQRLVEVTGGNPLFITELLKSSDGPGPVAPHSLSRFISAELARLGADPVRAAECICVDRSGVEPFVVQAVTKMESAAFESACAAAIAAGIFRESHESTHVRLVICHDVTREAIESSLTANRLAELRAAVADSIETLAAPAARDVFRLAEHRFAAATGLGRADLVRRAFSACTVAARAAADRAAHLDAARWFRAAQEMADLLGPEITLDDHVGLCIGEGTSSIAGADQSGVRTLQHGVERCWAAARPDLVGEILLASSRGFFSQTSFPNGDRIANLRRAIEELGDGHDALRARLVAELAAELTWHPEGDTRFALSDEALALAGSVGDNTTLAHVLVRRQLTIAAADTLDERRQACDELIDIAEQVGDVRLLFDAFFQRTGPAIGEGDIPTIRSCLARARALAEETAQPHLQWLVTFSEASLLLFVGDIPAALARAEAAANLGRDAQVGLEAVAFYREQIAEIDRLQGRLELRIDTYRRALSRPMIDPVHATLRYGVEAGASSEAEAVFDLLALAGFPIRRDLAQRAATDNLVLVALRLGRLDEAQELVERLEPFAATFGHGAVAHPCGYHYLGLVAAARSNHKTAFEHFDAAATVHERCGVPLLLAETLVNWKSAAVSAGRTELAASLAERALAALANRGATALEIQARS